MGLGALEKRSENFNINGIIEDYYVYAGENISAGNFVEFVNGVAGQTKTQSTSVSLSDKGNSAQASAVLLNNGDVLLVYRGGASSTMYLYGLVVSINGAIITQGTETQLTTTSYTGLYNSSVLLSDGKVFIAYSYSSNNHLYGMVISIEDKVITVNVNKSIYTRTGSGVGLCSCLLPSGKVFMTSLYKNDDNLYALVLTVTKDSITLDSYTALTTYTTRENADIASLGDGRVFTAYRAGNTDLRGRICSVNGSTVTLGTEIVLTTISHSYNHIKIVPISNTKVFIARSHGGSENSYLYNLLGLVCTISGTTITAGTDTELDSTKYSGYNLNAVLMNDGNILLTHCYSSTSYLYGTIISISNTTPTKISSTLLYDSSSSGWAKSALVIFGDLVFVTFCVPYTLNAQMWQIEDNAMTTSIKETTYETQVRNVTSSNANGISKTSGAGGSSTAHKGKVSVYQPYSAFNLLKNGDFEDGVNDWSILTTGTASYTTFTQVDEGYSGKCAKFEVVKVYTSTTVGNNVGQIVSTIAGHTYYGYMYVKGKSTNVPTLGGLTAGISLTFQEKGVGSTSSNRVDGNVTTWTKCSIYRTMTATTSDSEFRTYIRIGNKSDGTGDLVTVGTALYYDNMRLYDLTTIYGAGNEPTQAWCDANL